MASDEEIEAFLNDIPNFNLSNLTVFSSQATVFDSTTISNANVETTVIVEPTVSPTQFNISWLSFLDEYFALHRDVPELPNTYGGKLITAFTVFDVLLIFIIVLFLAFVEDRKISKEKQPIFIPRRPVRGFRKYAVIIETGHSPAGGTTSGVFIRLCGRLTKSPAFSLSWTNDASRQLFWSRNKDTFILSVPHYLGAIDAVELLTDAVGKCPPWFLKSIRVMSLDNGKCWKSKANIWLRGDRKPFRFRTNIIAALSTRDYMKKVFLQNHSWTMTWRRKLGSTFTCVQRCGVLWTSISLGLLTANYLMYKWPYGEEAQYDKNTGLRIPLERIVSGDDAVLAGVLGAFGGGAIAMLLRGLIRQTSSSHGWSRVDEKDDFTHLMNPDNLVYTDGAVVLASKLKYRGPKIPPYPPCMDDDLLKILDSLSPMQMQTVKTIVNSNKYNIEESRDGSPTASVPVSKAQSKNKETKFGNVVQEAMKINKGGNRNGVTKEKNSNWGRARAGLSKLNGKTPQSSAGNCGYDTNTPYPSARTEGISDESDSVDDTVQDVRPHPKSSSANNSPRKTVPQVSARFSDISFPSYTTTKDDYDSLSDSESDVESMTTLLKPASEINKRRRPQKIYDTCPWWDDRHGVYVSAPDSGDEHHRAVNQRYLRTRPTETECCRVKLETTFGENALLSYLAEEDGLPLGGVAGTKNWLAILITLFTFPAAIAILPYIAHERLPLPNAHALYYLYSVMLCFVFHAIIFSTIDAVACAILATMARRIRVANALRKNKASSVEIYNT